MTIKKPIVPSLLTERAPLHERRSVVRGEGAADHPLRSELDAIYAAQKTGCAEIIRDAFEDLHVRLLTEGFPLYEQQWTECEALVWPENIGLTDKQTATYICTGKLRGVPHRLAAKIRAQEKVVEAQTKDRSGAA